MEILSELIVVILDRGDATVASSMRLLLVDDGSGLAAMLRDRWAAAGHEFAEQVDAADAVVHVASSWDPVAGQREVAESAELLDALNGSGKRLLYVSDATVLGDTTDTFGNEDDPTSSTVPHPWQVTIERAVLRAVADGVRAAIVRPALIHGAGGTLIERLILEAKDHGRSVYVGDGHWRTSTVNAADLLDLAVMAIEHAPEGARYLAASSEVLTWREIAEIIAERCGVPGGATSISADEASRIGIDVGRMMMNSVIRDDSAQRRFGWKPHAGSFKEAT